VAKKAGATVVPAVIDGAFEAWPRDRKLPSPVRMYVSYAEPVTREQVQAWSGEQIAEIVSQRLENTLAESHRRRSRAIRHGVFL
jgi:1-acyl-sn-glycerol-3-phosphate acyltransferase